MKQLKSTKKNWTKMENDGKELIEKRIENVYVWMNKKNQIIKSGKKN